jgi:hypothetical protein
MARKKPTDPPRTSARTCGYGRDTGPAMISGTCEGPWWVWARYFVDGRPLYACEKHAKLRQSYAPCPLRPCKEGE